MLLQNRFFIFFFLNIFLTVGYGNIKLDSLKKLDFQTFSQTDLSRYYSDLAKEYYQTDISMSVHYFRKALKIAELNDLADHQIENHYNLSSEQGTWILPWYISKERKRQILKFGRSIMRLKLIT